MWLAKMVYVVHYAKDTHDFSLLKFKYKFKFKF